MISDPSEYGSGASPFVGGTFAKAGADRVTGEGIRGDATMSTSRAAASGDDDVDGDDGDDGEAYGDSKPKLNLEADGDDDEELPDGEHVNPSSAIKPVRESSKRKPRPRRISKHKLEYPALAPTFVKRVAQTALRSSGLGNSRVSADALTALTRASEWFFEQLGDDLGAYANHAGRKIIEESDVALLKRRYVAPP